MKSVASITATLILLSGCATPPPSEDPVKKAAEQAWMRSLYDSKDGFGPYPENYQEIVKAYVSQQLKDPESARFTDFKPLAKDLKLVDIKNRVAILGYSTCVNVNAKNSYGGYVGEKRYWLLIRDGKIIDSLSPEVPGYAPALKTAMAQMIDFSCQNPKVKQQ